METIIRNRTIRPSSRLESSKSYKIDTKKVLASNKLIVNIDHESKNFKETYEFNGKDVASMISISFRVVDFGDRIDISWSGAQPLRKLSGKQDKHVEKKNVFADKVEAIETKKRIESGEIVGLPPIVNDESKVLILGTMPGVDSLTKQEYYGNTRNLFWKMIESALDIVFPIDYSDKKDLLLKNKIALWDVCLTCIRDGSLDSNIEDETPNKIEEFILEHPNINAIAFNGQSAAKLFGKHFVNIPGIKLLVLPSSSPANAGVPLNDKKEKWDKIKEFI